MLGKSRRNKHSEWDNYKGHINFNTGKYVGIGVEEPIYDLDVNGDINVSGAFKVNGTDITNGTGNWDLNGNDIENNNTGNVGINKSSPAYKLDVVGDINFTGDIRKGGVIQSFGGGGSTDTKCKFEGFDISYWSYPGEITWSSNDYDLNGTKFDQASLSKYSHSKIIRAEFLELGSTGHIQIKDEGGTYLDQGGYTDANITLYKANCDELWTTVSSKAYADMDLMCSDLPGLGTTAITDIMTVVNSKTLDGVCINWESFGEYTTTYVSNFNTWLGSLKTALNAVGKKLNYDMPYIGNATIQNAYNFDYSSFVDNLDFITIMNYDIHFDWGYGMATLPIECLIGGRYSDKGMCDDVADEQGTTLFYDKGTLGKFALDVGDNMDKLIIGLPNIGFTHLDTAGVWAFEMKGMTMNQCNLNTTLNTNIMYGNRTESGELRWFANGRTFVMNDAESIRYKARAAKMFLDKWEKDNPTLKAPRREIAIWSMGGDSSTPFY